MEDFNLSLQSGEEFFIKKGQKIALYEQREFLGPNVLTDVLTVIPLAGIPI